MPEAGQPPENLDFYELEGSVLAFIGPDGAGGVLQFREARGWLLHAAGSISWDSFHQAAFRNFRAGRISAGDLRARGIPMPSIPEAGNLPGLMPWSANFRSTRPLGNTPPAILRKLKTAGGETTVHLVLEEDLYESALGDGRFLYPVAAFWNAAAAEEFAAAKNAGLPPSRPSHTIRRIRLRVDTDRDELRADLAIELFEHYSLDDVVRLLEKPS